MLRVDRITAKKMMSGENNERKQVTSGKINREVDKGQVNSGQGNERRAY